MKQILIVFLVLVISLSVKSQDDKKWDFQLNLGTTLTVPFKKTDENYITYKEQIIDTEEINYSSGFGYFAEFTTSYILNPKFSFLIGFSYSNISFKIDSKLGIQNNKGNITTSNIHFPLSVKYKLLKKIPISVSFGAYLRILTSANEKGTVSYDTKDFVLADPNDPLFPRDFDYESNIKNNYEEYDYGLSLQLDYEINISDKFKGIILTRFNYGLKNVINNQSIGINTPKEWNNYNFDIGIGIKI